MDASETIGLFCLLIATISVSVAALHGTESSDGFQFGKSAPEVRHFCRSLSDRME